MINQIIDVIEKMNYPSFIIEEILRAHFEGGFNQLSQEAKVALQRAEDLIKNNNKTLEV